jgi:hypothetical protein
MLQLRAELRLPETRVPVSRKVHTALTAAVALAGLGMIAAAIPLKPVIAQESRISAIPAAIPAMGPSYADLADLADAASVVARAQVKKISRLKPEQAPNVRPGWARVYVEAKTTALLVGSGLGESIKYLADVKLDAKGGLPKLKKAQVIVFANPVAGRPGELRLVAPDAQIVADAAMEQRVRSLLTELVAPGAAPRVTGVREAMHVPGNLAGEGETQVFMATEKGDPVSLTVIRRPGSAPVWGVSLSEIVDQAARPPARDTLTWYRLACFLPAELPRDALLYGSASNRRIAAEDYRMVMNQLGPCTRTRG